MSASTVNASTEDDTALPMGFDWGTEVNMEATDSSMSISPSDVPNYDFDIPDNFDVSSMLRSAPSPPDTEDIVVSLSDTVAVMDSISEKLSREYGNLTQRQQNLRFTDLDNRAEIAELLQAIEDSTKLLLDTYGVTTFREGYWHLILHRVEIVPTFEEWVERYHPDEEDVDFEDELNRQILTREVAKLRGDRIVINKQAVESYADADYLLLRIINHENLHNVAMGQWRDAGQDTTTGFHLSVSDGAYDRSQWEALNEGFTEVLNRMTVRTMVGDIPCEEWVHASGRVPEFLVCQAVTDVIGMETIFPSYMTRDAVSFASALYEHTQGELDFVRINTALQKYKTSRADYAGSWIRLKQTGDPLFAIQLLQQRESIESAGKELIKIMDILKKHTDDPESIDKTTGLLREYQSGYLNQPIE